MHNEQLFTPCNDSISVMHETVIIVLPFCIDDVHSNVMKAAARDESYFQQAKGATHLPVAFQ